MWIRILKNCVTHFGPFYKGQQVDLNRMAIEQLPKNVYRECPAPWEQGEKKVICCKVGGKSEQAVKEPEQAVKEQENRTGKTEK